MRTSTKYLLAALLTLLTIVAAVSQQTPRRAEPTSEPGAGQKLLVQFVGNWTFVDTFYSAQGQPRRATKGTCKQYMIQDGKFLESDFTFMPGTDGQYTGTGISAFDAGHFTTVWFDARRTALSIRQSKGTFDGKNIELWSTALDPDDAGRMSLARGHLENNGRTLIYEHFSINPGGAQRKLFDIVMTRQ